MSADIRPQLTKKRIEPGAYQVLDESGTVVARIEEWGHRDYRWHVSFEDRSIRGYDAQTINLDDIALTIGRRQ